MVRVEGVSMDLAIYNGMNDNDCYLHDYYYCYIDYCY